MHNPAKAGSNPCQPSSLPLGELILSVIKLPVPVPAVVLPPALSTATMYMAVFPAPFLYKRCENFDYNPKHSPVF